MSKTKRIYKKRKTQRKRKLRRGGTFADTLRAKTRRERDKSPRRRGIRIINPNDRNRARLGFDKSGRIFTMSSQQITNPPVDEWKEERFVVDNKYGPSESAFYAGPALENKYLSQTQGIKPIPHGKEGTLAYTTGHVYKGDFNQGKREGFGKYVWSCGQTYIG